MNDSALAKRIERHLALTAEERALLAGLETNRRTVRAKSELIAEGGPNGKLFVVHRGWFHESRSLVSGARQILRFHYPTDLMGNSSVAWSWAASTLTAVTDAVVCDVAKSDLGRLFVAAPRLGAMLYAMAAAEDVAMSDRLSLLGRSGAVERLAALLLDVVARLRVIDHRLEWVELPLTQTELGDATGLTKVHVNRTLRAMEERGLIQRQGRRIRIADQTGMVTLCGFVDRHWQIATDWLPGPLAA